MYHQLGNNQIAVYEFISFSFIMLTVLALGLP